MLSILVVSHLPLEVLVLVGEEFEALLELDGEGSDVEELGRLDGYGGA